IAEHPAQKSGGIGTRVKREPVWSMLVAQRPQIVDAQNVVGVGVSVEYGVYPLDSLAKSLRVGVGCGVDQNTLAAILCHYGRPSVGVAVVCRAPMVSACGCARCSCMRPSCIARVMYSDAMKRSNVISNSVAVSPLSSTRESKSFEDCWYAVACASCSAAVGGT